MIYLSVLTYRWFVVGLALLVAGLVFFLVGEISLEWEASRLLSAYGGPAHEDPFERFGRRLSQTFGLRLSSWREALFWASLGGGGPDWSPPGLLGRMAAAGFLGGVGVFALGLPGAYYLAAGVAAAYIPGRIQGQAKETLGRLRRQLPEIASLIAAEMAAGASAEAAVARAATFPGELSQLIQTAAADSHSRGVPLFTRQQTQGALLRYFESLHLPELVAFASQLDLVAGVGVDAPQLMGSVARVFAAEYLSQVRTQAEKLENALLFPVILCFFIPFVISILLPLLVSIFAAL